MNKIAGNFEAVALIANLQAMRVTHLITKA
jgi:hypothetical protein